MEEIARQAKVIVNWNGKNVSKEISPYLSSITYTDKEEAESDEISMVLDDSDGLWSGNWYPEEGDTVEILIGYHDKMMNCGLFQVDEFVLSGKPDQIEIKAIAAGITKELRTRNNKVFEEQNLKQIAEYFCKKHNLKLIDTNALSVFSSSSGLSSFLSQINLDRKTQEEKTDLAFLSELAKEFGFIFSIRGNKMVFTSYYELDNAVAIKSIDKTQLSNYSLTEKTYDTYASAKLTTRDSKQNMLIEWKEITPSGTKKDELSVKGHAATTKQAEIKVKAGLWNKNKFKQAGNLNDLPGDPELVSGMNFNITGCGKLSGKYHITVSTHTVSGDGAYTTSIEVRRTGTIPYPKQVPKQKPEIEDQYDPNPTDQNLQ